MDNNGYSSTVHCTMGSGHWPMTSLAGRAMSCFLTLPSGTQLATRTEQVSGSGRRTQRKNRPSPLCAPHLLISSSPLSSRPDFPGAPILWLFFSVRPRPGRFSRELTRGQTGMMAWRSTAPSCPTHETPPKGEFPLCAPPPQRLAHLSRGWDWSCVPRYEWHEWYDNSVPLVWP